MGLAVPTDSAAVMVAATATATVMRLEIEIVARGLFGDSVDARGSWMIDAIVGNRGLRKVTSFDCVLGEVAVVVVVAWVV